MSVGLEKQIHFCRAPTDEVREAQLSLGLDLSMINADNGFGLPMPTVLIIGADKTIRWIDVHPNYATRTETSDILAALDKLG
ncbi:hypothetical protein ABIA39_003328 [Nocardia sp. GAS34]|uniref:hypothetical protein n=1 Tax=unclassified Nocardia TaxID=2637762 RepID=UPI003D261C49